MRLSTEPRISLVDFNNTALSGLMETVPADSVCAAEWANLCLEERVAARRQAVYEDRAGRPTTWPDWRAAHARYVQQEVRRRHPLSAAFDEGDSSRPHIEPNQELYRVERIDALMDEYATGPFGVDQLRQWISNRDERTAAALADFTHFINRRFADGRPDSLHSPRSSPIWRIKQTGPGSYASDVDSRTTSRERR